MESPGEVRVTGEPGGAGVPWRLRFTGGPCSFSLAMSLDCLNAWQELLDHRSKLIGPHLDALVTPDGDFVLRYRGGDSETCSAGFEMRGEADLVLPQLREAIDRIRVASPRELIAPPVIPVVRVRRGPA